MQDATSSSWARTPDTQEFSLIKVSGMLLKMIRWAPIKGRRGASLYVAGCKTRDVMNLKSWGSPRKKVQLVQFLEFVIKTFPWYLEEGMAHVETWEALAKQLRASYTAEGQEKVPVGTFTLWSSMQNCLDLSCDRVTCLASDVIFDFRIAAKVWKRLTKCLQQAASPATPSPAPQEPLSLRVGWGEGGKSWNSGHRCKRSFADSLEK